MFIVCAYCGNKSELTQNDKDLVNQMMKTGSAIFEFFRVLNFRRY